jgi:hypothetical protein
MIFNNSIFPFPCFIHAFRSGELKELLLLKGSRLISVNAKQAASPKFFSWFKSMWERGR